MSGDDGRRHWGALALGARDSIPMLVGAAPFGLIFGALALSSGIPVWATLALSAFVFAGSCQFIAVGLLSTATALPVIWLTTFVINLRHALYSATLLPYARNWSKRWRWTLAFWLTDETFAVVENRFRTHAADCAAHSPAELAAYWLGSSLAMYLNWLLWTLLGVLIGQNIPHLAQWGLDFAMVATFVAIVTPQLRSRPMVAAAVVAGVTALAARGLPYKLGLILAALLGVAAGTWAEQSQRRNPPEATRP